MTDHSITAVPSQAPLPADDPDRKLTVAEPDGPELRHILLAGDVYTVVVPGSATEGRFCLIDMLVNDGGGPPPHRHDFEEMFSLLDGELQFTCRGQTQTVKAPFTINIPSNAPHQFKNTSGKQVHMLCLCAPAGQDEFFMATGVPVESRTGPLPEVSKEEKEEKAEVAKQLAAKYRTEMLEKA